MQFLIRLSDLVYDTFVLIRNVLVSLFGPRRAYVLLELAGPYPDHRTRDPWWVRQPQTVEDVRRQLAAIRADPRAAGVVITIGDLPAGLASVQSLRGVLADYRARGGRIVAYLPQATTRHYYLASVADAVVMPESGTLDIGGAALEVTFLGDALERAGVEGEFEQIAEYKSAVEPFTRRAMSEPMREQLNAILDSVFDDLTGEIAAARGLDPAAVREVINRAPLSAADARGAGLVDALLYEDELPAYLAAGGRPPAIVSWRVARRRLRAPFRWRMPGRAVGVVTVRGPIQMGESRPRPPVPLPGRGETSGHASLIRAIRSVERNPLFGAIVLSIDSPGGSALASDLIWRAVVQAARQKPVVAYFGNVAASGGYYIAAGAHRIVAQAGTLTGSIGVISGKFTVHRLAARAGVHQEILTRGEAAAMASPFRTFSGEQRRRLRAQAEEIYARFVDRVAEGRRLPREHVQTVARGRVWTGRQAMQHRLVDRLGDFYTALDTAKELMGLSPARVVPVLIIRPPRAVTIGRRAALGMLNAPGPPAAGVHGGAVGLASVLAGTAGGWMSSLWECADALLRESVLALMPWDIRLR
ncbi:MAG TPA: signal peptide peptidase SppA [bacterium]|nr:signal peptide peptidase SppA [bacterium]